MKNKTFLLVGIFCLVLIFSMLSVSKIQADYECEEAGCVCIVDQQYDEEGCLNNTFLSDKECPQYNVCCCPSSTPACPDDEYCNCAPISDPCDYVVDKTCEYENFRCCCFYPVENGNGNEDEDEDEAVNGNFIMIENPLQAAEFEDILDNVIDFIFQIALVLVPLMVVIAGFLFVTAGGNSEQINKAKTMIIWTVIGFLIILLSKGIMGIIMNLLGVG